jgi:hypothetical protein
MPRIIRARVRDGTRCARWSKYRQGIQVLTGTTTRIGEAATTVRALAGALADHAVPALRPFDLWKARLAAPQLVPVGVADAARAAEDLRSLVRWVDDGNCFWRAVVGAARTEQLLGARTGAQVAQAPHAAVAVVPTSMRRTGWSFHAATAFRSAEDGTVRVVDHLLGQRAGRASGTFTTDEWAALVGRRGSDVRLQHVLDNVPTGGGPITMPATAGTLRRGGRMLARSLQAQRR